MGILTEAATTLVTMILLAPLIALMPQATLAAVVIAYSIGLIRPLEFLEVLSVRRTEFKPGLSSHLPVWRLWEP